MTSNANPGILVLLYDKNIHLSDKGGDMLTYWSSPGTTPPRAGI